MTKSIKWVAVAYNEDGFDIIEAGFDKQACLDAMAKAKGVTRTELIDARGHVSKRIHFESSATTEDSSVVEDDEPTEEKRGRGRPKKSD